MKINIIYCVPAQIPDIFVKNLVHEIWLMVLLTNQIAIFLKSGPHPPKKMFYLFQ